MNHMPDVLSFTCNEAAFSLHDIEGRIVRLMRTLIVWTSPSPVYGGRTHNGGLHIWVLGRGRQHYLVHGSVSSVICLCRRGELVIIRFIDKQTWTANLGISFSLKLLLNSNDHIATKSHSY